MSSPPSASPVSWSSIPHKGQLAIICSIRMVDFYQQAALQAYMYYQLASFAPAADESEISFQVGVLSGVFTAAQVFTSIPFGRLADSPAWGRKNVILLSLVGQGLSCLGLAFSSSFAAAVTWRVLGSAVNATIGGARTALSEVTDRKYHSRTFLLLPLAWNVANIIGPPLGGLMSDPVQYYPRLFGENSTFGGRDGVQWMRRHPYATPNIFSAVLLFLDALLVFLAMRDTLPSRRDRGDVGLAISRTVRRHLDKAAHRSGYTRVLADEAADPDPPTSALELVDTHTPVSPASPVRFREVLTLNVLLVLLTVSLFDFHLSGFTSLWTILLSTPQWNTHDSPPRTPLSFTGGLGFAPASVGLAMSALGVAGVACQLTLYPRVSARHGLLRCTAAALGLFPVAYALAPFLARLTEYPVLVWVGIVVVAALVVGARTFVVPGIVLLNNNSCPRPELLGTVHGMGATVSSAFRTVGPIVAGHSYSQGITRGRVGEAWWMLALVAMCGCIPSWYVRDGV